MSLVTVQDEKQIENSPDQNERPTYRETRPAKRFKTIFERLHINSDLDEKARFKPLPLNEMQRRFVKYVRECCFEKKSEVLVVNSPAGTGKTHCIKLLLNLLGGMAEINILTPTHKAASLFMLEKTEAHTIHRFFQVKPEFDSDGKLIFNFEKITVNHKTKMDYKILFADECSMIDSDMLKAFQAYGKMYHPCLIIFMGDEKQLPPVKNKDQLSIGKKKQNTESPVFTKEFTATRFSFHENMRAREDKLRLFVDYFRQDYYTYESIVVDLGEPQDESETLDDIRNLHLEHGRDCDTVYLTFTNLKKDFMNQEIRRQIYGQHCVPYRPGEKLIFSGYKDHFLESKYFETQCFDTIESILEHRINKKCRQVLETLYKNNIHNPTNHSFYSSEEIQLEEVNPITLEFSFLNRPVCFYVLVFYKKTQTQEPEHGSEKTARFSWLVPYVDDREFMKSFFKDYKHKITHKFMVNLNKMKDELERINKSLDTVKVQLQEFDKQNQQPDDSLNSERTVQCSGKKIEKLKRELIQKKESLEDQVKHLEESIEREKKDSRKALQVAWKNFWYIKNILTPKVDYSYALTVHKSQGSQWEQVFVDLKSMYAIPNISKKLLYTAVSRAREKVSFTQQSNQIK